MKKRALKAVQRRILSPWWIFFIDLLLTSLAFSIAYVVRMNFSLPDISVVQFMKIGGASLLAYIISYTIFKSYRGVIRHTDFGELIKLLYSTASGMLILFIFDQINHWIGGSLVHVPHLVVVLHFILSFFFLGGFRMLVRETYAFLTQQKNEKRVFIYGAGDLGVLALEAIKKERKENYQVVGFIDDDARKWKTKLRDVPIFSFPKAMERKEELGVETLILAIADLPKEKTRIITELCLENGLEIKILPAFNNWIHEKIPAKKIRRLKIEDLLGRDEILLDMERISKGLTDKVVLVSGAAGSIGSEMVRQLVRYPLRKLVLLDQAESALYDLQQELIARGINCDYELVIADISNKQRMQKVFEHFHPKIVYNAAAYKHVPLMEENPYEALNVNVKGTKILADLSVRFGVEKFIMVSTDKAVNPTNVMGASKRLCEIYIQALSQNMATNTSFVTTRFGNVLGSNGSVVPLFKRQIEKGGPVTVTHPEITRYFMTIPEACQLVLEAGFMGKGGEIYVFDMGDPVKIADLAKRMIRLSGLTVGEDIDIKYTGLRAGEKLYEELLATKENTKPTHNKKIMIGKVRKHDYMEVNHKISDLLSNLNHESNLEIVARMKDLVPEFISKNSDYEKLDQNQMEKQVL
ncbi:nucleoside-diphosphate sugar epimerase/dehydratase [Marinifilum sp. D714]|uniref:polysaccharide biosynthesis protein n=1 Tax=Marinifilum sp. D714 TaxID=2937523 RepID=UPI0027C2BAFC|nr:nucleoside-diphosphate sugar epimerase/dehydratase [Marinifilum sp. D714]MDQ2178539.1 polysaccharide biosynthesis protein [Marinifilum sp. D714]